MAKSRHCFRQMEATVQVLRQIRDAGINVYALASQLQEDGAKSFVNSWNELMEVINSKGVALKLELSRVRVS